MLKLTYSCLCFSEKAYFCHFVAVVVLLYKSWCYKYVSNLVLHFVFKLASNAEMSTTDRCGLLIIAWRVKLHSNVTLNISEKYLKSCVLSLDELKFLKYPSLTAGQ